MNAMSLPKPLVADVRQLIDAARQRVALAVNAELTQLYWQIGRRIGTELLQGQRGEYGKQVVVDLARQLTADFGKGWSERQLRYCVRVAEVFPDVEILHTLCAQLSTSRCCPRAKPCRPNCTTPLNWRDRNFNKVPCPLNTVFKSLE